MHRNVVNVEGGGGRGVLERNVDLNYRNLRGISDLNCRPYTQFLRLQITKSEDAKRARIAVLCKIYNVSVKYKTTQT